MVPVNPADENAPNHLTKNGRNYANYAFTVAQAKGMPNQRVLWRYAARNAVLPQIQSFALSIGFIVGGTIVMEMVFSYPGVGKLLLDATNAKDYALMQGLFLMITFAVLVANLIVDLLYVRMDPRVRAS